MHRLNNSRNRRFETAVLGIFTLSVLYGMAQRKSKEVLDWYGNPLPEIYRSRGKSKLVFKVEEDADGTKYWRAYTADGKLGDRLPIDGPDAPYLQVTDENGKVAYDSRKEPPLDAKILPGYIGEKHLKRNCPG